MTAIVVNESNDRSDNQADYMPMPAREYIAERVNEAWAEFADMYTGQIYGEACGEAFWKYLTR